MQVDNSAPLSLSINQRNLYLYYLNHRKKHKNVPCFVPKIPVQGNRMADYMRTIESLEEKQLIRVDRSSDNYTGWIILDPKST
jgi:hypothetical protein